MGACHSAQERPAETSSTQGSGPLSKESRTVDCAPAPLHASATAADGHSHAPAWVPATHPEAEHQAGPCSAAPCKRHASTDLGPLQTLEPARHTHDSASSHPGLASRSGSLQQQQQQHLRPAQRRRCMQPDVAPGLLPSPQSEDGGGSRRTSIESVRPVLVGDVPLGSLDLGAPLVSPFEAVLQSARSMDPPGVTTRLRSTPAGTVFERPRMGDRRNSVQVGALQRQAMRRSISGGFHRAAEPGIERILALCTSIFRTDAAAVSLRDGGRELRAGGERAISAGALSAACAALEPPGSCVSVVADPAADARLEDAPSAREEVRFFAAAPLVAANGYRLGSLCLAHSRRHELDESGRLILRNMAELIVRELWGCYEHEHQQRILQLVRCTREEQRPGGA